MRKNQRSRAIPEFLKSSYNLEYQFVSSPNKNSSSVEAFNKWMEDIQLMNRKRMIIKYFVDKKVRMILNLHFQSLHFGQPFEAWLSQRHPKLILIVVIAKYVNRYLFYKMADYELKYSVIFLSFHVDFEQFFMLSIKKAVLEVFINPTSEALISELVYK